MKVVSTNHRMDCTTCGLHLGILAESNKLSKKFNKIVKFKCICYCKGESFVVKSLNDCYFVPDDNINTLGSNIEYFDDYVSYKIIVEKRNA